MKTNRISSLLSAVLIAAATLTFPIIGNAASSANLNEALSKINLQLPDGVGDEGAPYCFNVENITIPGPTATVAFTMYLEPGNETLQSSDTYVRFYSNEYPVGFQYQIRHYDYDLANNKATAYIVLPANDDFKSYTVDIYTVSNGINGTNFCYQTELDAHAGNNYPLYAVYGTPDWVNTKGKAMLGDYSSAEKMQSDGVVGEGGDQNIVASSSEQKVQVQDKSKKNAPSASSATSSSSKSDSDKGEKQKDYYEPASQKDNGTRKLLIGSGIGLLLAVIALVFLIRKIRR